MLEALSNELYMLGEDFTAIETRLLEKTARILTPDILTSALPRMVSCMPLPSNPAT